MIWSDKVVFDKEQVKFLTYQQELCPDTKRLHFQGYVVTYNPVTMKRLKEIFSSNTMHCEVRYASHERNVEYCSKSRTAIPNTVFTYGTHDEQGKRNDLEAVVKFIKEGAKIEDVISEYPSTWVKYERSLTNLINRFRQARTSAEAPKVSVYYGPCGSGKSRKAFSENHDIYCKDNTKWWNGYEGQKTVLMDDFRGEIEYTELLKILDRYPYQGETKGGYVNINCTHFIITSNRHPKQWYSCYSEESDWEKNTPLKRRITEIIEMKEN